MQESKEKGIPDLPMGNEKLRILVVDDDEYIREILKDILTISGHQVVLSANGEEALKNFYEQEFDLVMTDLGMPGISGWEVNQRIKQTHPQTPVVIISGWGAQLSEDEIRAKRVDLVLAKPFNIDQIQEIVTRFGHKISIKQEVLTVPI